MIIFGLYLMVVVCLIVSLETPRYLPVKTVASASFVITAFVNAYGHHSMGLLALFLPGLLLFMMGDIVLATRKKGSLKYGMMAFLMGNVCFLTSFLQLSSWHFYPVIMALVLLMGLSLIDAYCDMIAFNGHKTIAFLYAFILTLSCVQCAIVYHERHAMMFLIMAVGYLLYFVSDLILMFVKFGTRQFSYLTEINLLVYYAGLFLMAYSFLY